VPLISKRRPWSLGSFACAAVAILFFGAWFFVARGSDSLPLGFVVAALSFLSALLGAVLALVGLMRREGSSAASALLCSVAAALPISPVIVLGVLMLAVW
jgi:hypothetical protein